MGPLFVAAVTCWCCALLATPRRPRLGNEMEVLVYTRLLGRQQLLALLGGVVAAVALLVWFLASLPLG